MNLRTRIGVATSLIALCSLPVASAQAVEIPSDLEFSYTMNEPIIGQTKNSLESVCYQSMGENFSLNTQGGMDAGLTAAIQKRGNEILCTIVMERTMSNVVISGTAEASAQGQSGKGSFQLTCETGQRNTSFFSMVVSSMGLPAFGANPYGVQGTGYVSCVWSIAVDDEQKSQLAGTLELQGSYSQDSERVSCEEADITVTGGNPDQTYCVAFDMTINAYLTGATGAYAGRTGEGTLTQRVYAAVTVPLNLEVDTSCPPDVPNCDDLMTPPSLEGCPFSATDPGTGGWTQWPAIPPVAAPPGYQGPGWYLCGDSTGGGDGGSGGTPEESPYDPSIPPCVPGEEGAVPPEGFSSCVNPVPSSQTLVSALSMSVRAAAGEALSLSTSKKSGAPRFVSPAKSTADTVRPFGASATSIPTVRLATVPGATCAVTATSGSAKATLVARGVAVRGQLDTKVNASTLRTRLKAAVGAQAVITANCSTKVGKRSVRLPAASVTVKFT